jgi:hypothetical protein
MDDFRMLGHVREPWNEINIEIDEFPGYTISNSGVVVNTRFGQVMKHSRTQHGEHTVGLMRDGHQYRRSVKVLVARAFVDGETDVFNTPILLNGVKDCLLATNIAWRPRWFAWKYSQQFEDVENWWFAGPVIDENTGEMYEHLFLAALKTGSLVKEIRLGLLNRTPVFPTGHTFRFA